MSPNEREWLERHKDGEAKARWARDPVKPMMRSDLDTAICGRLGCTTAHEALMFQARCHPDAATWVCYDREKDPGVLRVICASCSALIARVRVAAEG